VLYETRPDDFDQGLKSLAQELGVSGIKRISTIDIPVEEWVLLKCQYGCPNYRKRLVCPPFSPEPARTRTILGEYTTAFLLRYDIPGQSREADMQITQDGIAAAWDAFLRLERYSFLNGRYKAFVFGLNHCPGCEVCSVESGRTACKNPQIARPSLEACGINVRGLVEAAGWDHQLRGQNVLKGDEVVSMISLLLLE
jgi:predicted metal-binding protein